MTERYRVGLMVPIVVEVDAESTPKAIERAKLAVAGSCDFGLGFAEILHECDVKEPRLKGAELASVFERDRWLK